MAISKEKLVGHWDCPDCGQECEVGQAARRGNHFYTDCGVQRCGINQGTGAGRQNRIWQNARFLSGVTVKRPGNVTDDGQPKPISDAAPEPEQTDEPSAVADFDPDSVADDEPKQTGSNAGRMVGAAIVLASIVGGVLMR